MRDLDFIKAQAENYANICIVERDLIASVHLEDRNDEEFWNRRLQDVKPGKYNFIYRSRVSRDSDNEASGCNQCLSYMGYFSKYFFACVDTDLNYLKGGKHLSPQQYVAQTYTYSWENHICEKKNLQNRFELSLFRKTDFNFVGFLSQLSRVIYEPLQYLLYFVSEKRNDWSIKQFNACIPSHFSHMDIQDNGKKYLCQTRKNFHQVMDSFKELDIDLQISREIMAMQGISNGNAYLYIQGHKLYGLIKMIGGLAMEKSGRSFSEECLSSSSKLCDYVQMEKVLSDIKEILGD